MQFGGLLSKEQDKKKDKTMKEEKRNKRLKEHVEKLSKSEIDELGNLFLIVKENYESAIYTCESFVETNNYMSAICEINNLIFGLCYFISHRYDLELREKAFNLLKVYKGSAELHDYWFPTSKEVIHRIENANYNIEKSKYDKILYSIVIKCLKPRLKVVNDIFKILENEINKGRKYEYNISQNS